MTQCPIVLNAAHPDNGGKAHSFGSLGFTRENPELLAEARRAVAETGEVVELAESIHGEKHVVDGKVSSQTEQGLHRAVRTVWIIDRGAEASRLVTAYPGKE